ncbi:MAG: hypothetical protein GY906_12885 [bacterium]|nr:hypothetical protein [bacterium]
MEVLPFDQVFAEPFETDVHFVTYQVQGHDVFPRLNKPVLSKLREQGGEVLTTFLAFDFDNPGHAEWTREGYEDIIRLLFEMSDAGFALALGFTHFYTTRHGCRFVYVLDQPIPVDAAESVHRGVVRDFAEWGLELDTSCSDWTRLFRAPFVMRGGKPTWEDEFFEQLWFEGNRLDPNSIQPQVQSLSTRDRYGEIVELDLPQPSPDAVSDLLTEESQSGKIVQSGWYKEAKRRLKGRNCYPCLFENAALANRGSRDNTIQSYMGEATALLYHAPGSSPELIYALFLDALQQLEPDDDTPDWTMTGWASALRWWAREEAKAQVVVEQEQKLEAVTQSITERVVSGMRGWCRNESLNGDPDKAIRWAMEHLIACTATNYHVMTASGHYDLVSASKSQLAVRIRELGMEPVIPLEAPREDGKGFRKLRVQDIIDDFGTVVTSIEGTISTRGAIIKNMGRDDATLVLPLFHRKRNLTPEYSTDVDTWLRHLGGDYYQRLKEWIALALDFESGPICALSIAGPPGCGKKLMMQGLAECINTEALADAKEFGRFQSGIMRTPFLQINEGFPNLAGQLGARDPADTFRHLVSGDPMIVERKFRDPVVIRNPLRIVFAANNLDVIQVLTGHRDLSPEDRAALALRIFHLDCDQAATDWLRAKGGLSYTGKPGGRWIRGDSGDDSNYIVAKHFLHLYANERPIVPKGNRLLMEGEMNAKLIRLMSTRSGSAPDVVETLIRMIENKAMAIEGLAVQSGNILVTTSAIVEYHRTDIGRRTNRRINHKSVGQVLKGLIVPGSSQNPRTIKTKTGTKHARWRVIDAHTLLEEAIEHGYPCTQLQTIIAGQEIASEIETIPVKEPTR